MKKFLSLILCGMLFLAVTAYAETYTGTAKGFGGDVIVTVTVEDGMIVDIKAVGDSETPGIGTTALDKLPALILAAGNTDVDAVSGATYTSKAVLEAAAIALAQIARPETYTGTAKGFGGNVTVTITVENGVITSVKAEGPDETPGIGTPALDKLPALILAAGSADVDAVSGATYTSTAVFEAAKMAIAQIAVGETFTGTAKGFGGDVTVTVTVVNGVITDVKAEGANETPGIGTTALEKLPALIVAAGNTDVDAVSGATYTSQAILEAVNNALGVAVPQ